MVLESRTRTGQLGKSLVAERLTALGHTIVARNWRWRRLEVDFISVLGNLVVFHEVKSRSWCAQPPLDPEHRRPSTAQQGRLICAAQAFMHAKGGAWNEHRFDLWFVTLRAGQAPLLNHMTGAWDAGTAGRSTQKRWRALR